MKFKQLLPLLCLSLLLTTAPAFAQNIAVKTGEKIAFLGDSITWQGVIQPLGYVRLVMNGLEANGVKAEAISAGVSGNRSNDMLGRVESDVISKKPEWMTLSCGVNDVWHGVKDMPLDEYKKNITGIIEKAQAANIKVVVLTSTLIYEEVDHPLNQAAIPYNDFLRQIAKEKGCRLADLNADFRAERAGLPEADTKKSVLTYDGIHMVNRGNMVMAAGVLRAFGLNEAQLQKARASWQNIPAAAPVNAQTQVTLRQMEQLQKYAAAQNKSLNDLVNEQVKKYLDAMLATAPVSPAGAAPAH